MTTARPTALIDADILIKLSVLDIFVPCLAALGFKLSECATMESMRFSAGLRKLRVREKKAGPGAPAQRLLMTLQAIAGISSVHPSETMLSAQIVGHSTRLGLAVDPGEAIALSVCIRRGIPYVTTGDKKAIRSFPFLEAHVPTVALIKGRVIPFEHLLIKLVERQGLASLHAQFVAGQHCDSGLRNILKASCANERTFIAKLNARLGALRGEAPGYVVL